MLKQTATLAVAGAIALMGALPPAHGQEVGTVFGPGNSAATGTFFGDQPECLGEILSDIGRTPGWHPGSDKDDPGGNTTLISNLFFLGAILQDDFNDCADIIG